MNKLFVSYDCGASYIIEAEAQDVDTLVNKGKELDEKLLRWEIEDEKGNVLPFTCRIFGSINTALFSGNIPALGEELQAFLERED